MPAVIKDKAILFKIYPIILLLLFVIITDISGQSSYYNASSDVTNFINRLEIKTGKAIPEIHTFYKPFNRRAVTQFLENLDSTAVNLSNTDKKNIQNILFDNSEYSTTQPDSSQIAFLKYFYVVPQDFYRKDKDDYFISVNPVIHLEAGLESGNNDALYINTRGIKVRGLINDKVGFYSYISDNQARFPAYVNNKIDFQERGIPGEGWNQEFGDGGYDFFTARGYIDFQATKNIGIQFGQDKNFLGHGIRSLLLSDYSNDYLFLKINTQLGRFKYQNIFAELIDYPMRSYGGRLFDKKYSTTHTLSMNLTERFHIALFENVIYGRSDEFGKRGLEMHYFNPVIFYRAIEHHLGDADKVSIGLNWRWLVLNRASLYGQIYIDDFHLGDIRNDVDSLLVRYGMRSERKYSDYASFRNKFAIQAGFKFIDLFTVKNLDFQAEVNLIRPYVYSHYDTYGSGLRPSASYSHYSQPLAHPMGANLREFIGVLNYQPHHKWNISATLMHVKQGVDTAGVNMGYDIMQDYSDRPGDYNMLFLQGKRMNVLLSDIIVSWQFRHNYWLDARFILRNENYPDNNTGLNSYMFNMGLRMNISPRNHYF